MKSDLEETFTCFYCRGQGNGRHLAAEKKSKISFRLSLSLSLSRSHTHTVLPLYAKSANLPACVVVAVVIIVDAVVAVDAVERASTWSE